MASKGYQTDASQFPGKDAIGKPMGSRDDDWVTVEGVRYVPETPLKAEIERLQNVIKDQRAQLDKLGDRFDAQSDEIARLRAELKNAQADKLIDNMKAVETEEKLRAALEKVYLSVKPLLPDGWSDATHVMNVISGALAKEGK